MELRTDTLPDGWSTSTIGAEFDVQLGKMLDRDKNVGVFKPYLGNRSVQWSHIDVEALETMAMTPSDLSRFRLRRGDLLVCEGGEVGRAAIWDAPIAECYYQKALHRLRPTRGFDVRLMLAFLRFWADHDLLSSVVTQTSIAHLTKEKLAAVPLPVPPPAEQRAIAEALSDVDALIAALDALIAKKRAVKTAAMQQFLTGRQRLPGFSGEWESKTLGDAIERAVGGGTPSRSNAAYWNGPIPWATVKDISTFTASGTQETITAEGLSGSASHLIPAGTLILATRMLLGKAVVFDVDVSINQDLKALFLHRGASTRFMFYWFEWMAEHINSLGSGSTVRGLALSDLRAIDLLQPPLDEQEAIAAILSDMDAEIAALEARRDKTSAIKTGMMQELLTGRTRLVQSPVARPAPQRPARPEKARSHNWAIDNAVVLGCLAERFGKPDWPLARVRRTKLTYLLRRHTGKAPKGFLKQAAGPYDPKVRYGGPEQIAQKNGYVRESDNGGYEGFVAAENVAKAFGYFETWYGADALDWLEQFRRLTTEDLGALTTVDHAALELRRDGRVVTVEAVKEVLAADKAWAPKLTQAAFTDEKIEAAIQTSTTLFGTSLPDEN